MKPSTNIRLYFLEEISSGIVSSCIEKRIVVHKEDNHFNSWNRGFIATAHMHHTHLVLDASYSRTNKIDVSLFKEMQTFMYAVLQDHLKTGNC
jgi:hypothetical protein